MLNKWKLMLTVLIVLLLFGTSLFAQNLKPFTVILDSGHNPNQQGALGLKGIYEVVYNDNLVAQIAEKLKQEGFTVVLTRQPTEEISLENRTKVFEINKADLFLSIHHDSAQIQYLNKITTENLTAYQTIKPIQGYSIFVSKLNPEFEKSFSFAKLLAQQISTLERNPSLHHAEKIKGEDRNLLDIQLGIYQFDDLIVLKKNKIPAVLFEVGVIVDAVDELYVSNVNNQKKIVNKIVNAVVEYQK